MGKGKGITSTMARKPKTRRGKRWLEKRAPKVVENSKTALFVRGGHTSETVTGALKDLAQLKKPNAATLRRRNPFLPFENDTGLVNFARKNDAALFLFGQHSKKRPHNLVFGRLFDFQILDMIEVGVSSYTPMSEFKGAKPAAATKPCLVFSGPEFETDPIFRRLQSLLADFFGGEQTEHVRLQGLELLISFTVHKGIVHLRVYRMDLKASGGRLPRVECEEIGPRMDLTLRRSKLASDDLYKASRRQPKVLKSNKPRKNISEDVFGSKLGRVHVGKQDLKRLQTRKVKALKTPNAETPDQ